VVLFNDVVRMFGLADLKVCVALRVAALDCRRVGATLVDSDLRGSAVPVDRLAQEQDDLPLKMTLKSTTEESSATRSLRITSSGRDDATALRQNLREGPPPAPNSEDAGVRRAYACAP
jgi:hypothetical protein